MPIRIAITILCGVGLYTALFMLAKTRRDERGELTEPSVVQSPRARLFGPPNAQLGAYYYPAVVAGIWLAWATHLRWIVLAVAIVSALPALASVVLFERLAQGDLIVFGLRLDSQFVASERDAGYDAGVQLLLIILGSRLRLPHHLRQGLGFREIEVSLCRAHSGVLSLGFQRLIGGLDQLLRGE